MVLKVLGLGLETSLWLLNKYFGFVSIPHPQDSYPWSKIAQNFLYKTMHPLFEKIFSPPATGTSAPVEIIFSQSGLLMRPIRARMGDTLLSQLMFLRCNNAVSLDVLYMPIVCLYAAYM